MKKFSEWMESKDNPDPNDPDDFSHQDPPINPNEFVSKDFPTTKLPTSNGRKLTNLLSINTLEDLTKWSVRELLTTRPGKRFLDSQTLDAIRVYLQKAGLRLKNDLGGFTSN